MASSEFIIYCRIMKPNEERETYTIKDLNENSSITMLKEEIYKVTSIEPNDQKITGGIHMEPLEVELTSLDPRKRYHGHEITFMSEVGISSGSTIFLETFKAPEMCLFERGKMKKHFVPPDNSSLFTSIHYIKSKGLGPSGKTWMEMFADEIRSEIAKAVQENPEQYTSDFLGMNRLDYCNWILNRDHWGGAIELEILTDIYEWQIFTIHEPSLTYKRFGWFHHPKVFLIHEGIHYNPLIMEMDTFNSSGFFKWLDYFGTDMVLEFVRQNRELVPTYLSTNIEDFALECSQCNQIMQSDKEARGHAIETEHVAFLFVNSSIL